MQPPIGDLALLADGRTAALLSPDGDVCWLCLPRVDSEPLLLSLLDEQQGGEFSLRPGHGGGAQRSYRPGSLILESRWDGAQGRSVVIDEALTADGDQPRLLRAVRRGDASLTLVCRVRVPQALPTPSGTRLLLRRGEQLLAVDAPGEWHMDAGGTAECRFPARHGAGVLLHAADDDTPASVAATERAWASFHAGLRISLPHDGLATRVLGPALATELLVRSACVLHGLHQRDGGGIVAAPTTSLPQWIGTSLTWDYRYAWLRDTSLAGLAMLRLHMLEDARRLAEHCGRACLHDEPRVLLRVDGSDPPAEHIRHDLAGYRDSRPVRIGNAAAEQMQLDVTGEVIEFAGALERAAVLPDSLRLAVPRLADIAAQRWRQPDYGIWENRSAPHGYTHSKLMAWTALTTAADMRDAGAVSGDAVAWRRAAAEIRGVLLREHVGPQGYLQLHDGGGGPDGSLSLVALEGLLALDDPRLAATLDSVVSLARSGLVARHGDDAYATADRCAPFIFPTFWLAQALERCGRDGTVPFSAACASRSALGLWGEVADAQAHTPLGNYPQVQSHASFVLCATARRGDHGL